MDAITTTWADVNPKPTSPVKRITALTSPARKNNNNNGTEFDDMKQVLRMAVDNNAVITQNIAATNSTLAAFTKQASSHMTMIQSNLETLTDGLNKSNNLFTRQFETLTSRLEELEKQNDRLTKNVSNATMEPDDNRRFVLTYLSRIGMDSRLGYVCAVPVMVGGKLYVAISLQLLCSSFARILPKQRKPGVRNQVHFSKLFQCSNEVLLEAAKAAQKMLPVPETDITTSRLSSRWAAIPAERFIEMCTEFIDPEDVWTEVDTIVENRSYPEARGVTFPRTFKCSQDSVDSYDAESRVKMSWGHSSWKDILEAEGADAYRSLLISRRRGKGVQPGLSHFSATTLFSQEVVKRHPRAPPRHTLIGGGGKRRRVAEDEELVRHGKGGRADVENKSESESGSESGSGSEDEEEEEEDEDEDETPESVLDKLKQGSLKRRNVGNVFGKRGKKIKR